MSRICQSLSRMLVAIADRAWSDREGPTPIPPIESETFRMHFEDALAKQQSGDNRNVPWWKELTGYQWFVFIVASLGWLFDTMDQQLFNLARASAMRNLLHIAPGDT